jgi:hypothetical protein
MVSGRQIKLLSADAGAVCEIEVNGMLGFSKRDIWFDRLTIPSIVEGLRLGPLIDEIYLEAE